MMETPDAGRLGLRLVGAFLLVLGLRNLAQVAVVSTVVSGAPIKFVLATGLSSAALAAAGIVLWVFADRLAERLPSADDLPTVERLATVGLRLLGLYLVALGLADLIAVFSDHFWPSIFFRPLGSLASGFILLLAARWIITSLPRGNQEGPVWERITVMGLQLLGVYLLARAGIEIIGLIPDILSSIFHTPHWPSVGRELLPVAVQGVSGIVLAVRAAALVASRPRRRARQEGPLT